jgi:hypothetical protein
MRKLLLKVLEEALMASFSQQDIQTCLKMIESGGLTNVLEEALKLAHMSGGKKEPCGVIKFQVTIRNKCGHFEFHEDCGWCGVQSQMAQAAMKGVKSHLTDPSGLGLIEVDMFQDTRRE